MGMEKNGSVVESENLGFSVFKAFFPLPKLENQRVFLPYIMNLGWNFEFV